MQPMIFRNFGGIHQFVVTGEEELARIDALDAARWAATSAPLRDLQADPAFLASIDPAETGRVRVSQIVEARDWTFARLANRDGLREKSEVLRLARLDTTTEPGAKLRQAAEHVLRQLGRTELDSLSLADLRGFRATYRASLANGDGVVCEGQLPEPEVAALAAHVVATVGGVADASGATGAGAPELTKFLERGAAYVAWLARGGADGVQAWGPATAAAVALVEELDVKLEEYFLHCDLLRQEARTADELRLTADELRVLRSGDNHVLTTYLAGSPLATPTASGLLPLDGRVNALWQDRLEQLGAQVLGRALGDVPGLTRRQWREVKGRFAAYRAWQAEKPVEPFGALEAGLLAAYLSGPLPARLREFIAVDLAAAEGVRLTAELEKLILCQRWLVELANNFVNFSAIYQPHETALVERGSLVIDGRRLEFCIPVTDRAAHRKIAAESLLFLVYVLVSDKDGSAPAFEVAAPVTAGERGRLRLGKRGIFIDTKGIERDATIVDLVENPISIGEAIRAPFRRASAFATQKIEAMAGSRLEAQEQATRSRLATQLESTGKPAAEAVPGDGTTPKAEAGGGMQGLLIGGGIAFAALGSATAYIVSAIASVEPLNLLLALAGVVLAIVGLSALLGWFKLRRRDMALLLEANGWAVNAHMKVTPPVARLFTRRPALPKGSVLAQLDLLRPPAGQEARDEAQRGSKGWLVLLAVLTVVLAAALWLTYR